MSSSSLPPSSGDSRSWRPLGPASGSLDSLVAALSVHTESLASGARVLVLGDTALDLGERLLDLGARSVHVYDPDAQRAARNAGSAPRGVVHRALGDDIDVRDGAFDLALLPDLSLIPEPASIVGKLRRLVSPTGTVVAMARARITSVSSEGDVLASPPFVGLRPAVLEYAELYDLFALQFEHVTMTGVLPFDGVVFAELGDGEDLAVSVDTRLVEAGAPDVFVVLASREARSLDPYAIVQVPPADRGNETRDERDARLEAALASARARFEAASRTASDFERDAVTAREAAAEAEAAYAAMQLRAELLQSQLDEERIRVTSAEARCEAALLRVEHLTGERDAALTREGQLEEVIEDAQQALRATESRLVSAEEGQLERDDRIAALTAELDALRGSGEDLAEAPSVEEFADLRARAERAEAALALHVADLAQVIDAHAAETAQAEDQLRERASVVAEMERELARRESLVKELVTALDEARAGGRGLHFQATPPPPAGDSEEVARLKRKLDELAVEVARREAELVARAWRIAELENMQGATSDGARQSDSTGVAGESAGGGEPRTEPLEHGTEAILPTAEDVAGDVDLRTVQLEEELGRVRDELDALRQALTQEHAARISAESGEELAHARAELQRQAVLLEQLRGRSSGSPR